MVLPVGAETFSEAMKIGAELYQTLKKVIKKKYGQDATNVGDEGGFAPNILNTDDALDILLEAMDACGHKDKVMGIRITLLLRLTSKMYSSPLERMLHPRNST